jgi:hypothetical protein
VSCRLSYINETKFPTQFIETNKRGHTRDEESLTKMFYIACSQIKEPKILNLITLK